LDFVTKNIAIGDGVEAEDEEWLLEQGITHVLNVHPMKMEYNKIYLENKYAQIPWHDELDLKKLDEAIEFMDQVLRNGGKILVICGAGFERSPLTVFAYLIKKRGLSIGEALDIVHTNRPQSDIHLDWLKGWLKFTPEESIKYRPFF